MKENRLLIHLAHLELVKPTEMPVEAHEEPEITHRCKMQTCISFLTIKSLSLSLSLFLPNSVFFSCPYVSNACFATLSSAFLITDPHLPGLGAFVHVQSLSVIANLHCLSVPPFMNRIFLYSLVCCRHAFIFPQLLIIKSFIGWSVSKSIDVSLLTERRILMGLVVMS